ncbi:hypothetical protein BIY24_09205 [Halobacteriovorax marinus]|uniref:transporter substrate-binding domain-containing protein n=1 Tax=Halobacteriovorax marinus TaxID=97084 RepID=UPI000BC302F2|nr:transporter substrate-binding domain-containing protein [Halobacteriovorax marinus]ATH08119.1 hypothetical protein BIY24_09205 [Halobacteriovorax marinus]
MYFNILALFLLILSTPALTKEFKCSMAEGYAPFQYLEKREMKGLDVELVQIFNEIGPHKITLSSDKWDNLVSELYHTSGIDCLIGMEKTPSRLKIFKFSDTLYTRKSALIILANSKIEKLKHLGARVVCGDKDSNLEYEIVNLSKVPIRMVYMETKEKCMKALASGVVAAAIMPKKVAHFLASKFKIEIRSILEAKKAMDVGFAFKKKGTLDLKDFNEQLKKVIQSMSYKSLIKK